jgi:hypothetical protein
MAGTKTLGFVFSAALVCAAALHAGEASLQPISQAARAGLPTGEIIATPMAEARSASLNAMIGPTAQIFPHIAIGETWETMMTIVNLTEQTVDFTQSFFNSDGTPMRVTLRTYPQGLLIEDVGVAGRLPAGTSYSYTLIDDGRALRTGWANLVPASTQVRLGAYAVFRQKVPDRPVVFEALVPLSDYDDSIFAMPYDNLQGFETGMALTNPATNLPTTVQLRFMDLNNQLVLQDTFILPPRAHLAFAMSGRYPALAGRVGVVWVRGSTDRLSAIGLRFNLGGGGAFSSIPTMNWSGMFQ